LPNMILSEQLPGDGTTICQDIGLREPGWQSICDLPLGMPPQGGLIVRDDI